MTFSSNMSLENVYILVEIQLLCNFHSDWVALLIYINSMCR